MFTVLVHESHAKISQLDSVPSFQIMMASEARGDKSPPLIAMGLEAL